MSNSFSSSSSPESRDQILSTFHDITGFGLADSIPFLEQHDWKLQHALDAFYIGKDLRKSSDEISKKRSQTDRPCPSPKPCFDLNSFHTIRDKTQNNASQDDDRYYAELLQQYGDADESARESQARNRSSQSLQRFSSSRQFQEPSRNNHTEKIYHEKQEYLRCGIHSLNNLFQVPGLFTHQYLDSIIREFDNRRGGNEYGAFWIGDYDLRVLIEAIQRHGYEVRQINHSTESLQHCPWDAYFGLLINLNGDHWFTIKNLNGTYYNLDSTFRKPVQIGYKDALIFYLIQLIRAAKNVYIFAVIERAHCS